MNRYLLVLIISLTSFDKAMERRGGDIEQGEPDYQLLRDTHEESGRCPCFVKLVKRVVLYGNIPAIIILNAGLATAVHNNFIIIPLDRMAEVLLLSLGIRVIDRHMKNIRLLPRISLIILSLICGAVGELLDQMVLQRNGFRTNIGLLFFLAGISQSLRLGSLGESLGGSAPKSRALDLDAEADVNDHYAASLAVEEWEAAEREEARIRLRHIRQLPEDAIVQLLGHQRFTEEIESRVDVSWRRRIQPSISQMIERALASRDASRRDRRVSFQEGMSTDPARSLSRRRSASLGKESRLFTGDYSDIAAIARRGLAEALDDKVRMSLDPVVSPGAAGAGGGSSQLGTPAHVSDSASGDLSARESSRSGLLDEFLGDDEAGPADAPARVSSPSSRFKNTLTSIKAKFAMQEPGKGERVVQGELSRTRSLPAFGFGHVSASTDLTLARTESVGRL